MPYDEKIKKVDKEYFLNVLNTVMPNYVDKETVRLIKDKNVSRVENRRDYIELASEFKEIFNSDIFQIGPSRLMTLLRKKNWI